MVGKNKDYDKIKDMPMQIPSRPQLQDSGEKSSNEKNSSTRVKKYISSSRPALRNKTINQQNGVKSTEKSLGKKQSLFRNQSYINKENSNKSSNSIEKKLKLKLLEIDTTDPNEIKVSETQLLDDNNILNSSDQLNCILDTYDKDYEFFQEHIDKLRNQTRCNHYDSSNKENLKINSSKSRSALDNNDISQVENRFSKSVIMQQDHLLTNIQTTEAICSPKIVIQDIETQQTQKRNSHLDNKLNQNLQKILPRLKDYPQQMPIESQIQTERRGESKLIIKLQNDIQLLNEILAEEKEKNSYLENQVRIYEFKINKQGNQTDNMQNKIQYLENQISELNEELTNTKVFYEEMIASLQLQLSVHNKTNKDKNQSLNNHMQGISKIDIDKSTQGKQQSIDFLNTEELTLNEIQFQISPDSNQQMSCQQSLKKLGQLRDLLLNVSYQNKNNNFTIKNPKRIDFASPNQYDIGNSNLNNSSNVLMTSDYIQNSDISATISQYDNHSMKFLNHVNQSKIGNGLNQYPQNPIANLQSSGFPKSQINKYNKFGQNNPNSTNKSIFKNQSKIKMNQSSIQEVDDSVICEEAGVNVSNIKSGNFHIKKVDEVSQIISKSPVKKVQNAINNNIIEEQINSLIHQIDGYLLTQSNEPKKSTSRLGRDSGQFMINQGNLATFGGQQILAASLTGTQQLSSLWNNMRDQQQQQDIDFYSKRISMSNQPDDDSNQQYYAANFGEQDSDEDECDDQDVNENETSMKYEQDGRFQSNESSFQNQQFSHIDISLQRFKEAKMNRYQQ